MKTAFVTATTSNNDVHQWLHLVKLPELTQDDFITYFADKVSVSDVPDGADVTDEYSWSKNGVEQEIPFTTALRSP